MKLPGGGSRERASPTDKGMWCSVRGRGTRSVSGCMVMSSACRRTRLPPYPNSVAPSAQGVRSGRVRREVHGVPKPVADAWHHNLGRAATACTRSHAALRNAPPACERVRRYTPPATVTSLFRKWCKASTPARPHIPFNKARIIEQRAQEAFLKQGCIYALPAASTPAASRPYHLLSHLPRQTLPPPFAPSTPHFLTPPPAISV